MSALNKRNPIAKAVKYALLTGAAMTALSTPVAFAAEEETDTEETTVTITGSRIKRTEVEGPSPIVVIDAESMKDQGFSNIFEAVQSLTSNTGSAFGGQANGSNNFSANAETVNLRGMGPNRTLVLLNGRRVSNYPRPYNSQNNVFNLNTIPFAAVDKIEIIAGGQSAIYGSDAIAGVLNIITKTDVEETTVTVHGHDTAEGGGEGQKLALVTGGSHEDFSWTLGIDITNQSMLQGNERSWLDDRFDNPSNVEDFPEYYRAEPRTIMAMHYDYWDVGNWQYLTPSIDCTAPTRAAYRVGRGDYCTENQSGIGSYINGRKDRSAFLNLQYELNNAHSLFADVLYSQSNAQVLGGHFYDTRFVPDGYGHLSNGYLYTENPHENNMAPGGIPTYIYMQRTFSIADLGGINGASKKFDDKSYSFTIGAEGDLGDYDYNAYVSYSQSKNEERENKLTEEGAAAYFIDATAGNYMAFLNLDNIFGPIDQAARDAIFEENLSGGTAKVTSVGATITGDLFDMPAGTIQVAATAEWSREEYDVNLHPRTLNTDGLGWANLTGTEGGGERDRASMAIEGTIPLLDSLNWTIAARYDDYRDDTDVAGASTWQTGLEWRPNDEWLIRASHSTAFKAPDLHQINAALSGYFQSITDQWLAAVCTDINAGGDGSSEGLPSGAVASATSTCSDANNWNPDYTVPGLRGGEKRLEEETGESTTVGFVWSALENDTTNISLTLDWYNIKLENEVVSFPSNKLFEYEQECRNGTRDINSGTCQNIVDGFISRNSYSATDPSPVGIDLVTNLLTSSYINAAMRDQTGLESEFRLRHDAGEAGIFGILSRWTHVLKYERQYFVDDPINEDYREEKGGDFRSKLNTTYSWQKNDWYITLEQLRYGSTTNDPDEGDFTQVDFTRLKPWLVYNLGINYEIFTDQAIRFGVNNLRNSRPRNDASFNGAPYYDTTLYPVQFAVMGRVYSIDYEITF